jgi:hypothetical protein
MGAGATATLAKERPTPGETGRRGRTGAETKTGFSPPAFFTGGLRAVLTGRATELLTGVSRVALKGLTTGPTAMGSGWENGDLPCASILEKVVVEWRGGESGVRGV